MAAHNFNFEGGEILTGMGATWFVSYAYFEKIDKKHRNWAKVSTSSSRYARYIKSRQYHIAWLKEVLAMNPVNLNKNTIGLDADQTKAMAKELLSVMEQRNNQSTGISAFNKKMETAVESFAKSTEEIADNLGNKLDSIDEDDIERFFAKIGKGIAAFFTVILPRFIKKTVMFCTAVWNKINKVIETDGWGFFAPFLFIMIGLIVLVLIATGIRSLFS